MNIHISPNVNQVQMLWTCGVFSGEVHCEDSPIEQWEATSKILTSANRCPLSWTHRCEQPLNTVYVRARVCNFIYHHKLNEWDRIWLSACEIKKSSIHEYIKNTPCIQQKLFTLHTFNVNKYCVSAIRICKSLEETYSFSYNYVSFLIY